MLIAGFDTETGGLDESKADLLTFYMAILDEDFKLIDELDMKLRPDGRLPIAEEGALKVNGINIKNHLEDPETVTYSIAKKKLIAFLKKHHKKVGKYNNIRPLGHNVKFDIDFVQKYLLPKEDWNAFFHYKNIDTGGIVDTLKDALWFPKELGTLGSIVDFLGLPKRAAHNAKEDTLMMIDVYKYLISLLKSKKENGTQQDLISLLEAE